MGQASSIYMPPAKHRNYLRICIAPMYGPAGDANGCHNITLCHAPRSRPEYFLAPQLALKTGWGLRAIASHVRFRHELGYVLKTSVKNVALIAHFRRHIRRYSPAK